MFGWSKIQSPDKPQNKNSFKIIFVSSAQQKLGPIVSNGSITAKVLHRTYKADFESRKVLIFGHMTLKSSLLHILGVCCSYAIQKQRLN